MLWLLMIPPVLVPFVYKFVFRRTYTMKEFGINIMVSVVLTAAVYGAFNYQSMLDFEVLNGQVTSKSQEKVSCEHSYSCNCRTVQSCSGSGANRSCSSSTVCDTCYEHSYDFDWVIRSTVGNSVIDRVDRRGTIAPPRFKTVEIGEPFASNHAYTNYIKASPDSIFFLDKNLIELYGNKIPNYPTIYDYYRIDRVINVSKDKTLANDWNEIINSRLRTMGAQKQVNIVVVLTDLPFDYSNALFYKWMGGKKNDVILVYGIDNGVVTWFNSTTLGNGNQKLNFLLRENSVGSVVNRELIESQLNIINSSFTRISMSEFEYLKDQREIPLWVIILTFIISMCGSIGIGFIFAKD